MKQENLVSGKRESRYLNAILAILGAAAVLIGTWVAWPVLLHLGEKII